MKKDSQMKRLTWSVLAGAMALACDYDIESEHEPETSVSAVQNKPASWVESTEELERIRRHIENLYDRDDVIHTFRAVSGDIVDCVPLQAQPAMRAPDMEGHVIMSAPTTVPREIGDTAERDERQSALALAEMFELEGVDGDGSQRSCPDCIFRTDLGTDSGLTWAPIPA